MQRVDPLKFDQVTAQIILAHGAGAGSQSDFMQSLAQLLASQGCRVWLFDFPYMQTMTQTGKRRPPDKRDKLLRAYVDAVNAVAEDDAYDASLGLWLGGKSMGGRMATHLLDTAEREQFGVLTDTVTLLGALVFGYPFHPPGKLEQWRISHFDALQLPVHVFQGERDTFGNVQQLASVDLPKLIHLHWVSDGDHSFKPRKSSGKTQAGNIQQVADWVGDIVCR